jgi:chromosome segregation ATPase
MLKTRSVVLGVVLCVVALYSALMYVVSLQRNTELQQEVGVQKQRNGELVQENHELTASLEQEKANNEELRRKNSVLKQYLRAGTEKVRKLDREFFEACGRIQQLSTEVSLLKAENTDLRVSQEAADEKLGQVTLENDSLKAKLASIKELKKAIRDLKRQARGVIFTIRRHMGMDKSLDGNRGYLVRDGKYTPPAAPGKVTIEVMPRTQQP